MVFFDQISKPIKMTTEMIIFFFQTHSSSESDPDPEEDGTHLQHYMQTASSFTGGTTVNAMAHVRDTRNSNYPPRHSLSPHWSRQLL